MADVAGSDRTATAPRIVQTLDDGSLRRLCDLFRIDTPLIVLDEHGDLWSYQPEAGAIVRQWHRLPLHPLPNGVNRNG